MAVLKNELPPPKKKKLSYGSRYPNYMFQT